MQNAKPSHLECYSILSTCVHATSYADACDRIQHWVEVKHSCYIVAANVHVVMTGFKDGKYQNVVNGAALVTPDGMPLVWGLKLLGVTASQRVYGPDLMLAWCDRAAQLGLPIYLYGSTPDTLARLEVNLKLQFENLVLAGTYAPPYSRNTFEAEVEDIARINLTGAAVVFVGLGCPKQEYWMASAQGKLNGVAIGVGAAFDFHSDRVAQAPRWMMKLGLEWLYRFSQEPGRLWQRYLINNPLFVCLFAWQLLKVSASKIKQNQPSPDSRRDRQG